MAIEENLLIYVMYLLDDWNEKRLSLTVGLDFMQRAYAQLHTQSTVKAALHGPTWLTVALARPDGPSGPPV